MQYYPGPVLTCVQIDQRQSVVQGIYMTHLWSFCSGNHCILIINFENTELLEPRADRNMEIRFRLTKPIFEIKYTPQKKKPKWRNWQTRYVQGVVRVPSCGFKSHLRHTRVPLEKWSHKTRWKASFLFIPVPTLRMKPVTRFSYSSYSLENSDKILRI